MSLHIGGQLCTSHRVEPVGDGEDYNDAARESAWTDPDAGAGDGKADAAASFFAPGAAQLASATTETELLQAFDVILAAAPSASLAFSAIRPVAVMKMALRRKKAVGEAVWTARVAAAYGGLLRAMKRLDEAAAAAPSVPPPLAAATIGRALFARAVSTGNADSVAGGTGGGGETKDEGPQPPPPHPWEGKGEDQQPPPHLPPSSSAAQPAKTLPRPVYAHPNFERAEDELMSMCGPSCRCVMIPCSSMCGYGAKGDVDKVRDLIAQGIDIDEQDKYGKTTLMYAAKHNHLEIAQELIRAGATLDLQNYEGRTALMSSAISASAYVERGTHSAAAAAVACFKIAQELIRAGAALDLRDKNGETALMKAAKSKSNIFFVHELIRAGAALDLQDNEGMTILMKATKNSVLEIAQEFVNAGAALDMQNKDGETALMIAFPHDCRPHHAIATILLEAGARCPGYKRGGVFNSKCKFCRESKKGHNRSKHVELF